MAWRERARAAHHCLSLRPVHGAMDTTILAGSPVRDCSGSGSVAGCVLETREGGHPRTEVRANVGRGRPVRCMYIQL